MLSADTIFDLMRNVSKTSGTTFLIATHDSRLAKHCDRIIKLVDGRIDSDKPNAATHSGQKLMTQRLRLHKRVRYCTDDGRSKKRS